MTSLVGRRDELSAIDRWFASGARLLTIAGPPGVGKSRLVRELAAQHAGTVVCDLTTCRSAADVERSVQGALGGVSRARLARVIATLDRPIVLDRFEHLVESARDLVASWTSGAGPHIVIASREPLGLAGESTIVLGPLDEADAIALYAARAKREVDLPAVAAIVRKLDRLPLAIELAAARASVLSDRDLLQRLERGIDAIDSRASRLRATILWSLDLLTAPERATLVRCAVFRGAFDGRAAETVARSDDAPSDTIGDLVALER
ncbi:MAG TPA: AAA family ATPase, partial [Labilithrix sp.]|nr:AAA family ATPase [Labilithrix sp.]